MRSILFTLLLALFTSFTSKHNVNNLKIVRFLTAEKGFQIIEFQNSTVTNLVSNRKPLRIELYNSKVKSIEKELSLIDFDKLKNEIETMQPIDPKVHPRVYYEIIQGTDTLRTKEYLLARTPNSLKRLDKLLFNYSLGM